MAEPEPTAEVNRVALKLPPFWDKTPELWFANIEAQFAISGITKDSTKYYSVVSAFHSDVLNYVSDIVLNPPAENRYNTLKARLLADFSDSEQRRIKVLLSDIALGDEKPSHLLRKMRQLANNKLGEDFLKTLWLQRLPQQTQAILAASDDGLENLAIMADKIGEVTHANVDEVQKGPDNTQVQLSELQAQIESLSQRIERLARPRDKSRQGSGHWRRRSKTPKGEASHLCWYHQKYGSEAKRCRSPCSFRQSGNP
ncbi:uncharacterized protein LOC111620136 [Centruroides sculpturatus]|uniref:uncharacterized protein LOC111620136 n=1 Tax=Centruroides sculpturatus TaxID=218467 RepID=UPI000C6DEC85|nr:uncharacterized protein LOC111620136 [Centruroides sculpturatus]